jgi:RNA polymerase sigma-70 factor (ECF subfamily)
MDSNEQEIISKAQKGDLNAFKEVINKYEQQVAKTVIGILGYCAEADDVGQETFIRLYKELKRFRGDSQLGTYVTRIAINLSLNELKRRKNHSKLICSFMSERAKDLQDLRDQNNKADMKKIVRRGIQELEPKFRIVIVLRLIDGYTTQETAHLLKLPLGTVLSRLARGQKKLKEIIERLYNIN